MSTVCPGVLLLAAAGSGADDSIIVGIVSTFCFRIDVVPLFMRNKCGASLVELRPKFFVSKIL